MTNVLREFWDNVMSYRGRYSIDGKDEEELNNWFLRLNIYQKKELFEHFHMLSEDEDYDYISFKELEQEVANLKKEREIKAKKKNGKKPIDIRANEEL